MFDLSSLELDMKILMYAGVSAFAAR